MLIRVGPVNVQLDSEDEAVRSGWQRLLGGAAQGVDGAAAQAGVRLELNLVQEPPPPQGEQIYDDPQRIVDVYRTSPQGSLALHFRQGAVVTLSPGHSLTARGTIAPPMFRHGQLEDVTYTALAPLLRRHGTYLVHSAAVASGDGAVLLVGPSHSGKTTTGLALLLAGWRHLASDVVALARIEGTIAAFPTPGTPRIRARTFELLPALRALAGDSVENQQAGDGAHLAVPPGCWGEPSPVSRICFPHIGEGSASVLQEMAAPVGLAQLMEQSIDRWDGDAFLPHLEFLTELSSQAPMFRVALAPDVERLPQLLGALP